MNDHGPVRLLLVKTYPGDDPCQYEYPVMRCGLSDDMHGVANAHHPFTGPRELTAEDLARAMYMGDPGTGRWTVEELRAVAGRILAALLEPTP